MFILFHSLFILFLQSSMAAGSMLALKLVGLPGPYIVWLSF